MPAYAIGRLQMRDPSWVEEYGPKTAALVEKYGGKYLVRGGAMETLEGDGTLPSLMVVLEFPLWSRPGPGTTTPTTRQ